MMGPIMGGVARLKYSAAKTYVRFEGNSLTAGAGTTGGVPSYYPSQVQVLPPINNQFTVENKGSSGQTTGQMIAEGGSGYQCDQMVAQKTGQGFTCVVVFWEGTNSISQSSTGPVDGTTAADLTRQWIQGRIAANPGVKIVVLTTLPRQGGYWGDPLTNQYLDDYNRILKANYRAWGAKALVDVRAPGSPFAFAGYTNADFTASSVAPYWSAGDRIHLNDAGYVLIARWVAAALNRLTAR